MKRKLIVACGSGVATSQTIASKIASKFEDDGIDFPVEAVDYKSIQNELPSAGIYVYVAQPDEDVLTKAEELGVKVFPGIPFLTGMGDADVYNEILALIK
ncbi:MULTISPECIES: PTS sugar transporter subunit IIB [Enterococcus]|uniref:PTS sugar transporter subunit IIB n=1 Tax=Enterococcus alishanensis TaxID=1303817 RepID=A0ABS6T8E7_9ENTE|nr:PTS sugar transporter subunit IIB [Enterococcus alishanensis]MBV7389137.1 PTS sugar transporter subunit IIB [Enterococcus alishanensis]